MRTRVGAGEGGSVGPGVGCSTIGDGRPRSASASAATIATITSTAAIRRLRLLILVLLRVCCGLRVVAIKETRDRGDRFRCGLETIVGQIIHLPYRWNLTRLYRTHTSSSESELFCPRQLSRCSFFRSASEKTNNKRI